MRELILAIRAIWKTWETGAPLAFRGEFYTHTLMTPFFNPGPNPYGNPKILLAAVGELMTASGMGRSWQSTLHAETAADAERRLRELNYSWEWLPDGCLKATTPVLPAVRKLPDGRETFFNQLIAAFKGWKDDRNDPTKAIRFGDGAPLDRDAVNIATKLAYELAFDLRWERGDAVLVDNLLAMHGRRTFHGTRKVLASLADPQIRLWDGKPFRTACDDDGRGKARIDAALMEVEALQGQVEPCPGGRDRPRPGGAPAG